MMYSINGRVLTLYGPVKSKDRTIIGYEELDPNSLKKFKRAQWEKIVKQHEKL
jgi:hypothetical protein